jgi:putative ABC transport system permease protein
MRGESPEGIRFKRFDKAFMRLRLLDRIPLRNLFRQPRRTISALFGIVAGMTLILIARGLQDSSNAVIEDMLDRSFREDLRADFIDYQSAALAERVRTWPGVVWAEGMLSVPADFRKGETTYQGLIAGLTEGHRLYQLVDERGNAVSLTNEGLLFGPSLQKKLHVESGNVVQFSLPREMTEDAPRLHSTRVAGFVWEPMGSVAYTTESKLRSMFAGELDLPPGAINSLRVKTSGNNQVIKKDLLDLPYAASVMSVEDLRKMVRDYMGFFRVFVWVMLLFGMGLAFSIVFNLITVSVVERSREIATMRMMGVTRGEIVRMVLIENVATALIGILIGIPVGVWATGAFIDAAQTEEQQELFSMTANLTSTSLAVAAIAIGAAVAISLVPPLRYVNRLDLAKAAKERSG